MIGTTFALYLNPLTATFTFNQLNDLGAKRSFEQSTQRTVGYSPLGNPIVRSPQFAPRCNWEIDTVLSEAEFRSLQALIALYQKRIVNNAGVLPYVVLYDGRIQWSEKGVTESDATKYGDSFEITDGVLSYFAYYLVVLIVPRDWFEPLGNYSYRVKLKAVEVGPLGSGYGLYDAPYPAFDPASLPTFVSFGKGSDFIYGLTTTTSGGTTTTTGFGSGSQYTNQSGINKRLFYWIGVQKPFFPCAVYNEDGSRKIIGPISLPQDWSFYLDTVGYGFTDTTNCFILPGAPDTAGHQVGKLYLCEPGKAWFDTTGVTLLTTGGSLCLAEDLRVENVP